MVVKNDTVRLVRDLHKDRICRCFYGIRAMSKVLQEDMDKQDAGEPCLSDYVRGGLFAALSCLADLGEQETNSAFEKLSHQLPGLASIPEEELAS